MAKLDKSVQKTLVVMGGVVLLALIGIFAYTSLSLSNTISMSGMANMKVLPDKVGIYFSVETKGDTSSEATDSNSEIVDKLTTDLLKLGFEKADIQTSSFSVYPDYDWVNGQQISRGYLATHSIKVELPTSDSSKIGSVIDAGVNAGAGISYINFELSQSKQNEYKAQVLKLATEDAKIKAMAVAEGSDKRLGRLISISDTSFNYYPWALYESASGASRDAAVAKEAATSIQPGEQDVSASVTAIYKIV